MWMGLVNADVVGAAATPLKMAAAPVVAVDLGLGRGRLVVGSDVAAAPAVAVAAADSVPGAGMADVDAVQAAAARLVMAAVILGTIKIAHKNTSVRTVWAGTEKLPINRISMGAQTFCNERLRFLHRRHNAGAAP